MPRPAQPSYSVPPPGSYPRELDKVELPQPTASGEPKEDATPSMAEPTPPTISKARKSVIASELAVAWRNKIDYLPDPTRGGAMGAGLAGQLFLFGGPKLEFAEANGTLTVDLIDETPRPVGQPPATPERWQFNKEMLRSLQTRDDTFGKSYVLFLPWPAYKADTTKVKISVRYDPDNGYTLFAAPSTVTITKEEPVWDSKTTTAPACGKGTTDAPSSPKPICSIGCAETMTGTTQLGQARDTATSAPVPAKPSIVGTWYREIGPLMCIIKIEADHITITAYAAGLLDDKDVKEGAVITADYHLARNGTTLVGLITGFDWLIEGDVSEFGDLIEALSKDAAGQIQKAFVDHPYAFNVRVYGDTLMVSNVMIPLSSDEGAQFASLFAGRYKNAGDKPVPTPKPIKAKVESGKSSSNGVTLAWKARGSDNTPRYFATGSSPSPAPNTYGLGTSSAQSLPLPDLIPPQVAPAGGPGSTAPSMPAPTPPGAVVPATPQMSPPTPPALRESRLTTPPSTVPTDLSKGPSVEGTSIVATKPPLKFSLFGGKYASDPNVRMQRLLNQSEDLRKMQNEWRPGSHDAPSHLTPERIHGGIY